MVWRVDVCCSFPQKGPVVGRFESPATRAAGKMPRRSIGGVPTQHSLRTARSSHGGGKALSVMRLAIWAGRLVQAGRSERSLLGIFLAGRRRRPGGPQRRSPKASGPLSPLSRLAFRVEGPNCVVSYLRFAECSFHRRT